MKEQLPVDGPSGLSDGSGRRPLVSGIPVYVGAFVVLGAMILLALSFRREPGLPARISQEYVAMMAGSLTPAIPGDDAAAIAESLSARLGFTPIIRPRVAEFELVGGRVHAFDERPAGIWFYRSRSAEMALAAAFRGTLDDLGQADEVRTGTHAPLRVFRKSSQTLVFWQDDTVLYVFVATLPSERVIGCARQLATTKHPD